MDNIRNVIGCPAAGLTPHELFDASPVVREFTEMFLRNKAFTNLPRKFNVGITGCTEHCTHAESQDLALTPATARIDGRDVNGFNVLVGGKMGSGGCQIATPLDVFVRRRTRRASAAQITFIFRDHGSRAARNRARLAFLLEAWGVDRVPAGAGAADGPAAAAGRHATREDRAHADHIGVIETEAGRAQLLSAWSCRSAAITADQLLELARDRRDVRQRRHPPHDRART